MSYMNKKTLDIILEENADFGFRLDFAKKVMQCTKHPVSGADINCVEVYEATDLSNTTFTGSISTSLSEASIVGSFSFSDIAAAEGVIYMTMTKETVNSIVGSRPSQGVKDSDRSRLIGYYDVIATDNGTGAATRIMEGKVYVSDGVTA